MMIQIAEETYDDTNSTITHDTTETKGSISFREDLLEQNKSSSVPNQDVVDSLINNKDSGEGEWRWQREGRMFREGARIWR